MNTIESNAEAEVEAQREALSSTLPRGVDEALVREKMLAGLTRAQAIEVIKRQAEWDARQATAEDPASPPKAPKGGRKPKGE